MADSALSCVGLPDEVLSLIFRYLPIEDEITVSSVCKQWNYVVKTDHRWKKLLKKWTHHDVEDGDRVDAYMKVIELLKTSRCVGKERWHFSPIPELWNDYESIFRDAEQQAKGGISTFNFYVRLNPLYEFSTKGKEVDNTEMNDNCRALWDQFNGNEDKAYDIETHEDAMCHAQYMSKQRAMTRILEMFEPEWFLEGLCLPSYTIDENGNIENEVPNPPDEEEYEDEKPDWYSTINGRFPPYLYNKIKTVFADTSEDFIRYFMSEGCVNENYQYGHVLYVSDTAAIYYVQYYDL